MEDINVSYLLSAALLGLSLTIGYIVYRQNRKKKEKKKRELLELRSVVRDRSLEEELESELERIRKDEDEKERNLY